MQKYYSDLFGEVVQPDNFIELLTLITRNDLFKKRNVWMWRGQASIKWSIDSGAFRKLARFKDNPTEQDLLYYEKTLLKQARHKGYDLHTQGTTLSDMELLSRLQHHGAATRLVDFSKNSLIALWFCVGSSAYKDETGLLLGIHSNYIGGSVEGILENEDYSSSMAELHTYNYPMFIEVPVVSKRIASQHGVFLYSDIIHDVKGSLKLADKPHGNMFIAITPELKVETRQVLIESFDIRNETLFPDLDGFSMANNTYSNPSEMYRW
jgi:FRG domain